MGAFKRYQEQLDKQRSRESLEVEEMLWTYLQAAIKKAAEDAKYEAERTLELYDQDCELAEWIAEMEDMDANFDDYYNDEEFLK